MTYDEGLLQKLHAPIDIEVVQLLLSIIPEGWWSMILDVESLDLPGSDEGFAMSISNDEGEGGLTTLPEKLYELVRRHYEIFGDHGGHWRNLRYSLRYDESEAGWKYVIEYSY